jgi:hypothetical protein
MMGLSLKQREEYEGQRKPESCVSLPSSEEAKNYYRLGGGKRKRSVSECHEVQRYHQEKPSEDEADE